MDQDQQNRRFDLHIVFGGMCLLARDEVENTLHVLLPQMHNHPPAHAAVLKYDQRYSEAPETAPPTIALDGKRVEFPVLGSTGKADLGWFDGVVDLTESLNGRVSRELIDGHDPAQIRARVILRQGEAASRSFGGRWDFGSSGEIYMATWLEWVIKGVQGETLEVHAVPLAGGGSPQTRVLRPVDDKIELLIFHAQPDDVPVRPRFPMPVPADRPERDRPITHFHAFYNLLDGLTARPTPKYRGPEKATAPDEPLALLGTDFTCVAATAVVGP